MEVGFLIWVGIITKSDGRDKGLSPVTCDIHNYVKVTWEHEEPDRGKSKGNQR